MPAFLRQMILLLCSLCCARLLAADFEPLIKIRAAAQDHVAANLGGNAQVNAAPVDPRLHLPACGAALESSANNPNAGNAWSVAVHCSTPSAWTVYVPVRVSERRQVLVLMRSLAPGTPVPADAVILQERDVASLPLGYLEHPEDVIGKLLRRPVAAGAALTPDAVTAPASIRRGQQVTLLGQAGGLSVRADGTALSDGASGDHIRVENIDSHRIVEGGVRGDGTVEVGR
jgi:flagella basal body P-ring formation protein FlgA